MDAPPLLLASKLPLTDPELLLAGDALLPKLVVSPELVVASDDAEAAEAEEPAR